MRITSKGQVTIPIEIRGPDVVARLRGTATVKMATDAILVLTRKRLSPQPAIRPRPSIR